MDDKFRDYAKVIARDIARVYAGARFRLVKGMKGFVFLQCKQKKASNAAMFREFVKKPVWSQAHEQVDQLRLEMAAVLRGALIACYQPCPRCPTKMFTPRLCTETSRLGLHSRHVLLGGRDLQQRSGGGTMLVVQCSVAVHELDEWKTGHLHRTRHCSGRAAFWGLHGFTEAPWTAWAMSRDVCLCLCESV